MIHIPEVTLLALTSNHVKGALRSIAQCASRIRWNSIHFLSDRPPGEVAPEEFMRTHLVLNAQPILWIKTDRINGIADYNRLALFQVGEHFYTSHVLICHHDGYVVNPELWDPAWLEWDYVGAPWPVGMAHPDHLGRSVRVGNGGFCLRSRRLYNAIAKHRAKFEALFRAGIPEDNVICCEGRGILEDEGCKFPPPEIAAKFAHENACPETMAVPSPFGIHFPPATLHK